jgi:hypothetical protein
MEDHMPFIAVAGLLLLLVLAGLTESRPGPSETPAEPLTRLPYWARLFRG